MALTWIFVLLTMMVHTRASMEKEQDDTQQKETKNVAHVESESDDEQDWDMFCKEVRQSAANDDKFFSKNKKVMKSCNTTKQYTRRKNTRGRGIQINEPLPEIQSLPKDSPWVEGPVAPLASVQLPSTSRRDTMNTNMLSSIQREQKKLSEEQGRMSAEIYKMKKTCSKMSNMLKGILNKLNCESSDKSESE